MRRIRAAIRDKIKSGNFVPVACNDQLKRHVFAKKSVLWAGVGASSNAGEMCAQRSSGVLWIGDRCASECVRRAAAVSRHLSGYTVDYVTLPLYAMAMLHKQVDVSVSVSGGDGVSARQQSTVFVFDLVFGKDFQIEWGPHSHSQLEETEQECASPPVCLRQWQYDQFPASETCLLSFITHVSPTATTTASECEAMKREMKRRVDLAKTRLHSLFGDYGTDVMLRRGHPCGVHVYDMPRCYRGPFLYSNARGRMDSRAKGRLLLQLVGDSAVLMDTSVLTSFVKEDYQCGCADDVEIALANLNLGSESESECESECDSAATHSRIVSDGLRCFEEELALLKKQCIVARSGSSESDGDSSGVVVNGALGEVMAMRDGFVYLFGEWQKRHKEKAMVELPFTMMTRADEQGDYSQYVVYESDDERRATYERWMQFIVDEWMVRFDMGRGGMGGVLIGKDGTTLDVVRDVSHSVSLRLVSRAGVICSVRQLTECELDRLFGALSVSGVMDEHVEKHGELRAIVEHVARNTELIALSPKQVRHLKKNGAWNLSQLRRRMPWSGGIGFIGFFKDSLRREFFGESLYLYCHASVQREAVRIIGDELGAVV